VETEDAERYQTVYALYDGSVAAPTAGLHFTESIFKSLEKKNVQKDFITLHVGAGTFMPVKSEIMERHEMHAEHFDISKATIENIIGHIDNIIAVGTTSLRTLESLYWLGVKLSINKQSPRISDLSHPLQLDQWECYDMPVQNIPAAEALQVLWSRMQKNNTERLFAKTRILIAPGYRFRTVKGLVTNFHQPQSTLLLLIAAFIGDDWKKAYSYAMENGFRFLSYGDGCLLWRRGEDG
jgi:S-adenosylmethionine:tRNA ribosyltransferase-isomerase